MRWPAYAAAVVAATALAAGAGTFAAQLNIATADQRVAVRTSPARWPDDQPRPYVLRIIPTHTMGSAIRWVPGGWVLKWEEPDAADHS